MYHTVHLNMMWMNETMNESIDGFVTRVVKCSLRIQQLQTNEHEHERDSFSSCMIEKSFTCVTRYTTRCTVQPGTYYFLLKYTYSYSLQDCSQERKIIKFWKCSDPFCLISLLSRSISESHLHLSSGFLLSPLFSYFFQ